MFERYTERAKHVLFFARYEASQLGGVRDKVPTSVEIPFSTDSKRVLRFTAEEADCLGHTDIRTEHLLLGILSEPQSLAAMLLSNHGIQLEDTARQEIIRLLGEGGPRSDRGGKP